MHPDRLFSVEKMVVSEMPSTAIRADMNGSGIGPIVMSYLYVCRYFSLPVGFRAD
ncbi:hypothetical protein ACH0BF_24525 [Pseudobacillus sp. 179-B 2D1 NHS]|uniref:hypothetical protein n=1 Tax=Pseudobacillus sp. 179-B 2D1 NHS TaxID=3374292 RepID=UPI003878FCBE